LEKKRKEQTHSPSLLAQAGAQPTPFFLPRTQPASGFGPAAAHLRGRPAAVTDGRAPPVIPDLESETDWGQSSTPSRPPLRA
jgi:hypothetical protein